MHGASFFVTKLGTQNQTPTVPWNFQGLTAMASSSVEEERNETRLPGMTENDIIAFGDNIQQEIDNYKFAPDIFHSLNRRYL